jgi:trimethylamine:corrinoid methyltransferase-like protein
LQTKWKSRIENLTQNDASVQNQSAIHFLDGMVFGSVSSAHQHHEVLGGMRKPSEQTVKSDEQRVKFSEFGAAPFKHLRDNGQKVWSIKAAGNKETKNRGTR